MYAQGNFSHLGISLLQPSLGNILDSVLDGGVDVVVEGDSLAQVVLGLPNTHSLGKLLPGYSFRKYILFNQPIISFRVKTSFIEGSQLKVSFMS